MILILFDAHRLDVSDELMEVGLCVCEREGMRESSSLFSLLCAPLERDKLTELRDPYG